MKQERGKEMKLEDIIVKDKKIQRVEIFGEKTRDELGEKWVMNCWCKDEKTTNFLLEKFGKQFKIVFNAMVKDTISKNKTSFITAINLCFLEDKNTFNFFDELSKQKFVERF